MAYLWLKRLTDGVQMVGFLNRWFWYHEGHRTYGVCVRIIDETIAFIGVSKRTQYNISFLIFNALINNQLNMK